MTQLLITLKDQSYLPNIRRIVKMMKRSFISLLAVVAVGISVPTVSFASSMGDPIGGIAYNTSGEYYEIDSKEDLYDLAVYVNGTGTYSTKMAETTAHDCQGLTFKMTLNIDFKHETAWNDATGNEDNYEPIGGYHNGDKRYFKGTFLGQGHTIRGIRVYRGGNDKDTDSYVGVFGLIGSNATVSGIVLTNARLTGFNNVGGIVGMAILDKVGSDKSTIDSCTVTGTVAIHAVQGGTESHGGIVGGNHYYPSSVKNCVSSVTLTIGEGLTSQYYGGISGWNNGGILDDNIVVGATIPGCKQSANGTPDFYGAITGYGTGSHRNYYARCTVAGVENAVNVGQRGYDDDYGATYSAHTIWFDDGITAEPTFTFDGNSYYAARQTVTLNIPTSDGNIFLYTVNDNDGHSISVFKDKFTMPAQNVVVTGKFVPTVDTPYFDPTAPEGEQQKSHPAVELTTDTPMPLTGGWYVVHGNVTLSKTLPLGNDATLILADGAHLKFAMDNGMPIGGHGINGSDSNGNALCSLTVYAQNNGSGKLTINAGGHGIYARSVAIHGGTINAGYNFGNVSYNLKVYGIYGRDGLTVTGGKVTSSTNYVNNTAGMAGSNILLSWAAADDYIKASSYEGTVTIAQDKVFIADGTTTTFSGIVADNSTISGKTLKPCLILSDNADNTAALAATAYQTIGVVLAGRTLYKDGNWNTLYLPFGVEDFEGTLFADATVKTLNDATFQDGTLTLEFSGNLTSMEAGRPYIVKWDGDGSNNLVNPTFSGVYINAHPDNLIHSYGPVTFVGTYAPVQIPSTGDDTKLFLGANSTLYWPNGAMTIGCQRAYFQLNGITAGDPVNDVRAFVLNFGDGEEASGITTTNFTNDTNSSDAWFDMSGRQLNGPPSRAGIYIHNGKKVVMKCNLLLL